MRSDIRRLSFIRIAQQLGFSIEEIGALLAALPLGRTPTQKDWARISRVFRRRLDERIAAMTHMRDKLDECIGCGCLSLRRCGLYNPQDRLAARGAGPQLLKLPD
jgi:MerR family redox-sensitive transcriptional activator SoxR